MCLLGVMVEQKMVLFTPLCSFPLKPMQCPCDVMSWVMGVLDLCHGIEQVVKSLALFCRKLKQLECCHQNTFRDMSRNFKNSCKFGLIQKCHTLLFKVDSINKMHTHLTSFHLGQHFQTSKFSRVPGDNNLSSGVSEFNGGFQLRFYFLC